MISEHHPRKFINIIIISSFLRIFILLEIQKLVEMLTSTITETLWIQLSHNC